MSSDYKPELGATAELDTDGITMCMKLIGELLWAIKILRVDIQNEVSMISSYQDATYDGNLQQILHIFAFFKLKKLTLYFDPNLAIIDPTSFTGNTEKSFYD